MDKQMDTPNQKDSAGISANTSAEQVTANAGGHGDGTGSSQRVASGHTTLGTGAGSNRLKVTAIEEKTSTSAMRTPSIGQMVANTYRARSFTEGDMGKVQRLRMEYEKEPGIAASKTPISSRQAQNTRSSPSLEFVLDMQRKEEDALLKCRRVLRKMQVATQKQKNISKDVKDGISELEELICVMETCRESWLRTEESRREKIAAAARSATSSETPTPTTSKNKRIAPSPPENPRSEKKPRESGREHPTGPMSINKIASELATPKPNNEEPESHRREKKPRSKKKTNRQKSEALLIKPADGHSYADILKTLRKDVDLDEIVKVRGIRKTKTGALLLKLDKGEKADSVLCDRIRSTLQEAARVNSSRPMATIVISDLDSCTTQEEVTSAVKNLLPEAENELKVSITAPNNREQVRAFITVPEDSAQILLKLGVIKIGWLRVRMKRRDTVQKCYRCFSVGHTQVNCKGPNRREEGLCFRCGEKGHILKECKNSPKCWTCVDASREPNDHIPGSSRCPLWKREQSKNRQ